MMTLSMGYNSVIMGFSSLLAAGFLIYFIGYGFILYKFAKKEAQASTGFGLIDWAYSYYPTSEPRGNYLPLIQLVKAFLQCLFLVAILDSGIAQSILILLVELVNIGFTALTTYRRKTDKSVDIANSSLIAFYLFLRCISFSKISQEHSQNLGTFMSVVLLLLLVINLSYAVFALYSEFFRNTEWRSAETDPIAKLGPATSVFTEIKEAEAGEKNHLKENPQNNKEQEGKELHHDELGFEGDLGINQIKVSHQTKRN
jgi:glucan phosphoethanolaminetransferase (alkaline phosphatase superfamily)